MLNAVTPLKIVKPACLSPFQVQQCQTFVVWRSSTTRTINSLYSRLPFLVIN